MINNWGQEIRELESWLEQHPSSIVFARLADCYLQSEDVNRAVQICEEGLAKHPNYPSAHYVLAKCHLARREYQEAEKSLKQVLMLDPHFLRAHKRYGDIMQDMGWEKSSEMSYRRILEIDPLDEETRHEMESLQSPEGKASEEVVDSAILEEPEIEETEIDEAGFEETAEEQMGTEDAGSDSVPVDDMVQYKDDESELELVKGITEFEEDEERFSSILDDLFGKRIAEEELHEDEARRIIERAAKLDEEEPEKIEPETMTSEPADLGVTEAVAEAPTEGFEMFGADETADQEEELKDEGFEPLKEADMESDDEGGESGLPKWETMEPDESTEDGTPESEEEFHPSATTEEEEVTFADGKSPIIAEATEETPAEDGIESREPSELRDENIVDEVSIPELISEEPEGQATSIAEEEVEEQPESEPLAHTEQKMDEEETEFASVLEDLEKSKLESELPDKEAPAETTAATSDQWEQEFLAKTGSEEDIENIEKEETEKDKKAKIVTPTLGEIFAAQGQYAKAISVFEKLQQKDPDNPTYGAKIEELKRKMEEGSD